MIINIILIILNIWIINGQSLLKTSDIQKSKNGILILDKASSPYYVDDNLIIHKKNKLIIEPGVELRFEKGKQLIVYGTLEANGLENERIRFTKASQRPLSRLWFDKNSNLNQYRLVEGDTSLQDADANVTCKSLGFKNGTFYYYTQKSSNLTSHMKITQPKCTGNENSLFECSGTTYYELGNTICDDQNLVSLVCDNLIDDAYDEIDNWGGIIFERNAPFTKIERFSSLFYNTSKSVVNYVDVLFAGLQGSNPSSAITVFQYCPTFNNLKVEFSAGHGLNLSNIEAPSLVQNSVFQHNKGSGLAIRTRYGNVGLLNITSSNNFGDGLKYAYNNTIWSPIEEDELFDVRYKEFCYSQNPLTYPTYYKFKNPNYIRECTKTFGLSNSDLRITLHFQKMLINSTYLNYSLEVYDGQSEYYPLIANYTLKNNTLPESIYSRSNYMFVKIKFICKAPANEILLCTNTTQKDDIRMYATISNRKDVDLSIIGSKFVNNTLTGLNVTNVRSFIEINDTLVAGNGHLSGLHISKGAGSISIFNCIIQENHFNGINITYKGGYKEINKTLIKSNHLNGLVISYTSYDDNRDNLKQYLVMNSTTIEHNHLNGMILDTNYGNVSINSSKFAHNRKNGLLIRESIVNTTYNISWNLFERNYLNSLKVESLQNTEGILTNNTFFGGYKGGLRISTNTSMYGLSTNFVNISIEYNYFLNNTGQYAASIQLNEQSCIQMINITYNKFEFNEISSPFKGQFNSRLNSQAVLLVGSSNIRVNYNYFNNSLSRVDLASNLANSTSIINASFNWFGQFEPKYQVAYVSQERDFCNLKLQSVRGRIFDFSNRSNLAQIYFTPYSCNQFSRQHESSSQFPMFNGISLTSINSFGGVFNVGDYELPVNSYLVTNDIIVRPNAKLTIKSGTQLNFLNGIGMLVQGELIVEGSSGSNVQFKLGRQEVLKVYTPSLNTTTRATKRLDDRILRLSEGTRGRLEITLNGETGTVCNRHWTIHNSALVCHQLGYLVDPSRYLYSSPDQEEDGLNILMSEVECDELDDSLFDCHSIRSYDHSCTHQDDVFIQCLPSTWAGIRFTLTSKQSTLRYARFEQAGQFDYSTNHLAPALQIDYNIHKISNLTFESNIYNSMEVLFTNPFEKSTIFSVNLKKNNSNGIVIRSSFMSVFNLYAQDQNYSAFEYNPYFDKKQLESVRINVEPQRANVLKRELTRLQNNISSIGNEAIVYFYTDTEANYGPKELNIKIETNNDRVLVVDLIDYNPDFNQENVLFCEKSCLDLTVRKWNLSQNIYFPVNTSFSVLHIKYTVQSIKSGRLMFLIYSMKAPERVYDYRNPNSYTYRNLLPDSVISVVNSTFYSNRHSIVLKHYDDTEDEFNNLRKRPFNQTLLITNSTFTSTIEDVIVNQKGHQLYDLVPSVKKGPLSRINLTISDCLFSDNKGGIRSLYRYHEYSNIIWHFEIINNRFKGNFQNGIQIILPRLYRFAIKNEYENKTHTIKINNNEFSQNKNFELNIDGYYVQINITKNKFTENKCKSGLVQLSGTEKDFLIYNNIVERNEGKFMFDFDAKSHADNSFDIESLFVDNLIENNRPLSSDHTTVGAINSPDAYTIALRGIQNCTINRNTISNDLYNYELVGGVQSNCLNSTLDATLNWWGTSNSSVIKQRIFDVYDWNSYAFVSYVPFRIYRQSDQLSRGHTGELKSTYGYYFNDNVLGGIVEHNLVLNRSNIPYQIRSDLTIMPGYTMQIGPGVEMEFYPNVGLLVLGNLIAKGNEKEKIKMRPVRIGNNRLPFYSQYQNDANGPFDFYRSRSNIRLFDGLQANQGFLQVFNSSLKAWTMVCDRQLTRETARVVCKSLRKEFRNPIVNLLSYYILPEFKIPIWNQTFLCKGNEFKLDECYKFANYHMNDCAKQGEYVYIECGDFNLDSNFEPWGGIRFAQSHFESITSSEKSHLKHIEIYGAGKLHNELNPAIQVVFRTPIIEHVSVLNSTYHGFEIIQPFGSTTLSNLNIKSSLGYALNTLLLNVQTTDLKSSYSLLKHNTLSSSNIYSMIDLCDSHKEYTLKQRIIVYYKYSNIAKDCVKVFNTKSNSGYLGLRFMQVNLVNNTVQNDTIELYNGTLFNGNNLITSLTNGSSMDQFEQFYLSKTNTLSVYLKASIGREHYGFIAEVLLHPTALYLPPETFVEISDSSFELNQFGSVQLVSAGERNPNLYLTRNRFISNGIEIFNTSTQPNLDIYAQNTPKLFIGNNYLFDNFGGMRLNLHSGSGVLITRTSVFNNYFYENKNDSVLEVKGEILLPYNEVYIYRNFFIENKSPKKETIRIQSVVSQFTSNFIQRNKGTHILSTYGFENVTSPRNQEISFNLITENYAYGLINELQDEARFRSTLLASNSKQTYFSNYLFNKDNDFELAILKDPYAERDLSSALNASLNYWSTRIESEIRARIRDKYDNKTLYEVNYYPAIYDEFTLRNGKCDLGWQLIDDICFAYIGFYATYYEAEQTCKNLGGKLARETVAPSKVPRLRKLARTSQLSYETQTYRKLWLHTDNSQSGSCIIMDDYETVKVLYADCTRELNAFICEKYPVFVGAQFRFKDEIAFALGSLGILSLVILILTLLSCYKSRVKKKENFERQDTLRRSARNNKYLFSQSSLDPLQNSNRYVDAVITSNDPTPSEIFERKPSQKRILTNRFKNKYESQIDETLSELDNKIDTQTIEDNSIKTTDTYDYTHNISSPKRSPGILKKSNTHSISFNHDNTNDDDSSQIQISSFSPRKKDSLKLDNQSQSSNYENISYTPELANKISPLHQHLIQPPSIPPPSVPRRSIININDTNDENDDDYETIKSSISIANKKLQILSEAKKSPLLSSKKDAKLNEDAIKPPPMETAI